MLILLYKRADDVVFDDFPKISEGFPKLLRRPDERFRTFSEDCRRRLKKIQKCFDHTPTDFSVVEGTKEICYQT